MQPWKVNAFLVAMGAASLIPLAIAVPLWPWLRRVTLSRWRRTVSIAGLALATIAALVLPLWLVVMALSGGRETTSRSLGIALEAVAIGLVLAIPALVLLCFAKDRIRWLGLASCFLTLTLFALSLSGF